jgi:hypothetical protein
MNITFQPLLDWPWLIAFGAIILAFCSFLLFKRVRGALLRALTGAALFAALSNPTLHQNDRKPISDIAVVVVDESASNQIGNRTLTTASALNAVKKRVAELGNTELRITTVSSGSDKGNDGTRAIAALNRSLNDIPRSRFAGAIIITDGQVHDVPDDKALLALPAPIHTLITGNRRESDRKIVVDHAPHFALVGQEAVVQFHVDDQGSGGAEIPVTLTIPGQEPKIVLTKPGASAEVAVKIDHAGENLVGLSAEVRPGELSTQNNHVLTRIDGIRDRLRVLLISGQPNAGERSWRNLLKADSAVDLIHFTILRPPEKQDGTPNNELSLIAFPTTELFVDKLDKFDLVIFDRYRHQAILPDAYLGNIANYVRKGGALLVSSGEDYAKVDGLYASPLGEILGAVPDGNITEQPFKPLLSKQGERHPVTRDLAGASATDPRWGKWFRVIDTTLINEDGKTAQLMNGPDDKPLLVLRRVGEGRVAQILSDQGWLWARGYDGGGPEAELLKRIAHWAMKEPELEEEQLHAKQVGADIVIERRGLKDSYASITAIAPDGKTQSIPLVATTPGVFTARITAPQQGLYSIKDGELQTAIDVGLDDPKEASDLLATEDKMKPVAAATGGGMNWLEDGLPRISKQSSGAPFAGSGWINLKANGLVQVTAVREVSLFSTLISLAALLLLASLMWWREGR